MDKIESSELQGIDNVFGAHIAEAFEGLSTVSGPSEYQSFLKRDRDKKIFRFDYEDKAENFITAYSEAYDEEPLLPVVLYYREMGFDNKELISDIKHNPYLYSDEFQATYNMSLLPVNLTYKMAFLTRDKASLDQMQIAWYSYITKRKNHRLMVNYTLADQTFPVPLDIDDPMSIMFTELFVAEVGKLFSAGVNISIRTQILTGEEISIRPHIEFIGEWTSGTSVEKNYICEYGTGPDLYLCIEDHTTADTPDTPDSPWILFNEYEDCGEWLPDYTFNPADLVLISGEGYYLCLSQHDSTEENKPGVDSTLWMHFCNSERITNPVAIDITGERVGFIL